MNLTINRDNLITALLKLEDVVNHKDPSSIQSQILIETKDDSIELTATDTDTTIQTTTDCAVLKDGKVAVSGKHVTDIINNLSKESQIDISSCNDRDLLEISCSEGVYKLKKFPVSDFPVMPTLHSLTLSIKNQTLHSLIKKTIFVLDEEAERRGIDGLYFNMPKDMNEIVGTNGWTVLSLAKFQQNISNDISPFILHKKSALNITKHISDTSEVTILMKGNIEEKNTYPSYIQVNDDKTIITSKVLDGRSFPNYQPILTEKIAGGIKIPRTRLIKGLERVSVLSNPKHNRVKLSIQPDKLILSTETDNLGEALEEIDIEQSENVTTIDIYLSAKFLIEVLLHMNDDEVKLEYSSDLLPVFFKSISEEYYVYAICLMKPMD